MPAGLGRGAAAGAAAAVPGARRRRRRRVDRLRRSPAVGAVRRPARRRRGVDDVGVGRRRDGAARPSGRPAAAEHRRGRSVGVGQALRRLRRRDVGAGDPRVARARRRSSPDACTTSRSSWTRARTRFDPGQRLRLSLAGTDWPNTVAPPGPATLTVHGGELELPVWTGPSPHAAAAVPRRARRCRPRAPTAWSGGSSATCCAARPRAWSTTASTYDVPYDGEHHRALPRPGVGRHPDVRPARRG